MTIEEAREEIESLTKKGFVIRHCARQFASGRKTDEYDVWIDDETLGGTLFKDKDYTLDGAMALVRAAYRRPVDSPAVLAASKALVEEFAKNGFVEITQTEGV